MDITSSAAIETTAKQRKNRDGTIGNEIQALLKQRREMKCDTNVSRIQYIELCKTIRKKNEEKRKRNMEIIRTTTENNRSLKKIAKNMKNGREETTALKGGGGEIINKQDEILARIKQFYEQLYTPPTSPSRRSRTQKRISTHP